MGDLFDLSEYVAVVPGGAGLIGEALTEALVNHGATVVIVDTATEAGEELAETLGDGAYYRNIDITSERDVRNNFYEIRDAYGSLDVLVNAAYPRNDAYGALYEDVTFEDWQENVHLQLNSTFLTSHVASEIMVQQKTGGNIINLGSMHGVRAPDFSVYDGTDMSSPVEYSAIKGGVIHFTRYLASYLGEDGIRANVLSPGGVFNDQPEPFLERYHKRTPLGRMAEPGDFKGPVVFLASDASRYVTGHNLVVDGGWTIC